MPDSSGMTVLSECLRCAGDALMSPESLCPDCLTVKQWLPEVWYSSEMDAMGLKDVPGEQYYAYVLDTDKGTYVGHTRYLVRRVRKHSSNQVRSTARKSSKIVWRSLAFKSRRDADNAERVLKTLRDMGHEDFFKITGVRPKRWLGGDMNDQRPLPTEEPPRTSYPFLWQLLEKQGDKTNDERINIDEVRRFIIYLIARDVTKDEIRQLVADRFFGSSLEVMEKFRVFAKENPGAVEYRIPTVQREHSKPQDATDMLAEAVARHSSSSLRETIPAPITAKSTPPPVPSTPKKRDKPFRATPSARYQVSTYSTAKNAPQPAPKKRGDLTTGHIVAMWLAIVFFVGSILLAAGYLINQGWPMPTSPGGDIMQQEIHVNWSPWQRLYFLQSTPSGEGVYVIWRQGNDDNSPRYIYVGQGIIAQRLLQHQKARSLLELENHVGLLWVTWATISPYQMDGVERYLGDVLDPMLGNRHPDADPIPVNLPQ
ncbi:MAG: hypothetical protein OXC95_13725 [Dehalococcoidia bacterium]|nr:hypothetical protein [Dehalococcoidia bacterium]